MFAGIDIGGTYIRGILIDRSGRELSFWETGTPTRGKEIDDALYTLIENLATSASISKIDISGICVGSAGSIDRARGTILKSRNIRAFRNYPLVKNLEKSTGLRVVLENDATIALIGAWWKGNGSRFKNWIMLTIGTGIGGGIVLDNKIYTGKSGNAMEVGHMTIDVNGKECGCGNTGCWERYASATALVEMAEEALSGSAPSSLSEKAAGGPLNAFAVYDAYLAKDPLAVEVFDRFTWYLGVGVTNLVNIFNPEAVIIGGGLAKAHRHLIPAIKKVVRARALKGMKEDIQYFPIQDHRRIPALGAAKISLDRFGGG